MNKSLVPGVIVFMSICAGIVVAFIEDHLYTNGIILDEFVSGSITISELMAITVVVFALFGGVIAAIKS